VAEVGYASLGIIPSFDGFQGNLERGMTPGLLSAGRTGGSRFGGVAGQTAGKRFGSVFSTAAKASLVGLAGASALAFKVGKDAIDQASDLNESNNAVTVTYGKQARAVKKLGAQAAESLGLSNSEFNSMAVRFSNFADTISGGKGRKTVATLDDLTTRATDFASVMNLEVSEANDLFASGLAGESEPLRRFGIDISDAAVSANAYATGIAKSGEELTAAQKVQSRYQLIMDQTQKTQGDFKNTSDQLANSQRILSARWDDAQAKLGTALLPALTDVTNLIIDEGIPAFEDFSDWFTDKGLPALKDFADEARPLAKEVLPAIGTAFDTTKDAVKTIAPLLRDVFEGFNKLPDWVQSVIVLGAGAAALKSKLGGGKSGLAGGLLGGLSSLKPIPVVVTNPGFAAGGGAGGSVAPGAVAAGASAASKALPGSAAAVEAATVARIGLLRGLPLLSAAGTPNQINPEDEFQAFFENAGDAREAFNKMVESGEYTTKQLREQFHGFRVMFGDDFDYMSFKARTELDRIKNATPRELATRITVYGYDEAREAVEVALAPFMVGRNSAKESQGSDAMLPAPSDVPSRGRRTSGGGGGSVTVNQYIGKVNDSKQLNKDAAAKAQQAAMGGWG
jgi:hypothetical protein